MKKYIAEYITMSYYPEPFSHVRDKVKVVLDMSNYATKKNKIVPAGTQCTTDVHWRSPKGPNVRDLQGTFSGLLGDQQKNW